jgi:hypothetical protein
MEFYQNSFGEELDKDQFISLNALIKNNEGLFKTDKQGKFILWKWVKSDDFVKTSWIATNEVAKEGFKYVVVDGFFSFSHGNGKGHRPATYLFELDSIGVVARYRGKYKCTDEATSAYSLKEVVKEWERKEPAQPIQPITPKPKKTFENVSQHIGEVGDRLKGLELTVMFVRQFDNDFGVTTLMKFKDDNGNVFGWFSSTKTLEVGKRYRLNGSVKGHGEYNGIKETMLTRCMKIEEL